MSPDCAAPRGANGRATGLTSEGQDGPDRETYHPRRRHDSAVQHALRVSSGNTSNPASRGHFKSGQLRVADDGDVAVVADEARVRSIGDSGAHPLQPSLLSPAVAASCGPPGFPGPQRQPPDRERPAASAGARSECKRRDRAARARRLPSLRRRGSQLVDADSSLPARVR